MHFCFQLSPPCSLAEDPQSFLFPMQHSRYSPAPVSCLISLSPLIKNFHSSYILTEAEVNRAFSYLKCSLFAFEFWMYFNFSIQKSLGTILLPRFPSAYRTGNPSTSPYFQSNFVSASFKRGNFQVYLNKIYSFSVLLQHPEKTKKDLPQKAQSYLSFSHFLMTVMWEVVCKISGGLGEKACKV